MSTVDLVTKFLLSVRCLSLVSVLLYKVPVFGRYVRKLIARFSVGSSLLIAVTVVSSVLVKRVFTTKRVTAVVTVKKFLRRCAISGTRKEVRRLVGVAPRITAEVGGKVRRAVSIRRVYVKSVLGILPNRDVPASKVVVGKRASVGRSALAKRSLPMSGSAGSRMCDNAAGLCKSFAVGAAGVDGSDSLRGLVGLIRSSGPRGTGVIEATSG